jgi:AcrR family transcriptional regulator
MEAKMERKPTEDRKREIADATLAIIAKQGVRGFTTKSISKQVGLAEGTIFRHFKNKEEIVHAAIDRLEEILFEDFPAPESDPISLLGQIFRKRLKIMHNNPGILRIFFTDELAQAGNREAAERVYELKKKSLDFIRLCLTEAVSKGFAKEGLNPEALKIIVHGTALAIIFSDGYAPEGVTGDALAEETWQTLENLIRK